MSVSNPPNPSPKDNQINDILGDLYALMDDSKLSAGEMLKGGRNMSTIVNKVRSELATKLSSYIKKRDTAMFDAGVRKGKEES